MAKRHKKSKLRTKIEMYDYIIGNRIQGEMILDDGREVAQGGMEISYSEVYTHSTISKYYIITQFPDWLDTEFMYELRRECMSYGVMLDFYIHGKAHIIPWDSAELQRRMKYWKEYSDTNSNKSGDVFGYRSSHADIVKRWRMIHGTAYLNKADLDDNRTTSKISVILKLTCKRTHDDVLRANEAQKRLKAKSKNMGIRLKSITNNLDEYLKTISPFRVQKNNDITSQMTKKVFTDDMLAAIGDFSQGQVGEKGIPVGLDIDSGKAVFIDFKDNPDKAENMLITAKTGGGKSRFVKPMINWFLASNYIVTIMDYEGDEYTNYGYFVAAKNPEAVKIISLGKSDAVYVDPMEIPELTGDAEIDVNLKKDAIEYILGYFKLMVKGLEGEFDLWEKAIVSEAIRRAYESYGVTDETETWVNSKGMKLKDVYLELLNIVDRKIYVDDNNDNVKHKAAVRLAEATKIYFEEGESKANMFSHPMTIDELRQAKLIIFSFGEKGAVAQSADPVALAMKQLSIANIGTQISNYAKYIKHTFNVKIWEEFQRYIEVPGTASIVGNTLTGGRKRGDINIIITNDLAQILDEDDKVTSKIRASINTYCLGKIEDTNTIDKMCRMFPRLKETQDVLYKISEAPVAKTSSDGRKLKLGRYSYAFCLILDDDRRAVIKCELPDAMAKSSMFSTGVKKETEEEKL